MRVVLFLVVCLMLVRPAFGGLEDAIVGIYVTRTPGYSDLGTGFFTSDKGQILTVYHVVAGAVKIKVIDAQNKIYTNVIIDFIAPDRDLAVLQITDKGISTPYLSLANRAPTLSEELTVIGYPRGLPRQHFRTRSTVAGFNPSRAYRTPRGARLFNNNIHVVSVAFEAYGGMSGAPVVAVDRVLGVFSGSLHEGGSIAWAIPCKYTSVMSSL